MKPHRRVAPSEIMRPAGDERVAVPHATEAPPPSVAELKRRAERGQQAIRQAGQQAATRVASEADRLKGEQLAEIALENETVVARIGAIQHNASRADAIRARAVALEQRLEAADGP